jgi:hypothetical protein
MSEPTVRKYQTGREVLERFVPDYVPPASVPGNGTAEGQEAPSAEELKDVLLSALKAKLDQLHFSNPSQ